MPFRAAAASTAVEVEAEALGVVSMAVGAEALRVASMEVEAEASRVASMEVEAVVLRAAEAFRVEASPAVSAAAFRARPVEGR